MRKALFLCTGNYYRSRYAEIIFNWHVHHLSSKWKAFSRGLDIKKGVNNTGPLSPIILQRLQKKHIPFSKSMERYPMQVNISDLEHSQIIIALRDKEHRPYIREQYPKWENKVIFWNVADVDPGPNYDPLKIIDQNVLVLLNEITRKQLR